MADHTQLEAWASQKSFQPKGPGDRDGDGTDFRGQERSNDTHVSTTDPAVRLYKKSAGDASRLAYLGHMLMDNRRGLIAEEQVTTADGTAEVDAAVQMIDDLGGARRITTVGADKGYDRAGFVDELRERNVSPHVARKRKGSAIEGRTTRHVGYDMSIHVRRRIESIFGRMKTVGGMRKTRFRGLDRVGLHFPSRRPPTTSCALADWTRPDGGTMSKMLKTAGITTASVAKAISCAFSSTARSFDGGFSAAS